MERSAWKPIFSVGFLCQCSLNETINCEVYAMMQLRTGLIASRGTPSAFFTVGLEPKFDTDLLPANTVTKDHLFFP